MRRIRTHDLTRLSLKSYPLDQETLNEVINGVFVILSSKKTKFSAQRIRKTPDYEKNSYLKYEKIALIPKLLGFLDSRP